MSHLFSTTRFIPNEAAMLSLGMQLAEVCTQDGVIFLQGNLGAGKTTFCRGFLRGLGYHDRVKSPTYTLVEEYQIKKQWVYHFDLYRLQNPEELEWLGIKDYFRNDAICLIEWPEYGGDLLATPDLTCHIDFKQTGREIILTAHSVLGNTILQRFLK